MDIASQMEVELFESVNLRGTGILGITHLVHGYDLTVTATRSTSLDAKGGSLAGLANTGKRRTPKVCTDSLR